MQPRTGRQARAVVVIRAHVWTPKFARWFGTASQVHTGEGQGMQDVTNYCRRGFHYRVQTNWKWQETSSRQTLVDVTAVQNCRWLWWRACVKVTWDWWSRRVGQLNCVGVTSRDFVQLIDMVGPRAITTLQCCTEPVALYSSRCNLMYCFAGCCQVAGGRTSCFALPSSTVCRYCQVAGGRTRCFALPSSTVCRYLSGLSLFYQTTFFCLSPPCYWTAGWVSYLNTPIERTGSDNRQL
jgi:hypothetical protein